MAQLVIAAAGAAIGGAIPGFGIAALGLSGQALGWTIGSLIGSAFTPGQKSSGPRLSDLSVSSSAYGTPIPYTQGGPRIAGQIVWASAKREIATTTSQGKGGGSKNTTYAYEVDLLILLTDNEIPGITRVWRNGKLIWNKTPTADIETIFQSDSITDWARITAYTGEASQMPDPTYEAAETYAPAYRGRGSVFIEAMQLGSGGQIDNLEFEIGLAGAPALPSGTATYLLRYDDTTDIRWEDAVTNTSASFANDGYTPSTGKVTVDSADPLFGLYSADMNTGIASRSGTWSDGGRFSVPDWPTTGDFTAEVFVKLHSANSTPNDVRGGWVFNSGSLGYAFVHANNYTAHQNKGANSVYVTSLGAVQLSQGDGQDAANDALRLTLLTADGTVATDSWTHLAFVRSGTTWKIFSGPAGGIGELRASGDEQHASSLHSNPYLGSCWSQGTPLPLTGCFIGNMIEYRTCNVALYSGDYLVPVGPLPTTW